MAGERTSSTVSKKGGKKKSIAKKSIKKQSIRKKSVSKKSIKRGSMRRSSSVKKGKKGGRRKSSVKEAEEVLPDYNAENVRDAMHEMDSAESPINLSLGILKKIRLPPLLWYNYETKAYAMKITNTAYSVVLMGLWGESAKPYINGGPLMEDYEFSQIHFHWGQNNNEGSEHTVDGLAYPFEMHVVFYKKSSGSHEKAKAEEDGIIIFVYLFKLAVTPNQKLSPITDALPLVISAYSECSIEPVALMTLIKNVNEDYILYLGSMKYKCTHGVMWLICRDTLGISDQQLDAFRLLQGREGPVPVTTRVAQDLKDRKVFAVNPSPVNMVKLMRPLPDHLRKRGSSLTSRNKSKMSVGKRGSMKRGSVKRGSVKRGSVKRGSVKRGSVKRGSVKRGSVKRK